MRPFLAAIKQRTKGEQMTYTTEGAREIRDTYNEEKERQQGPPAELETYLDDTGGRAIECTTDEREAFERYTGIQLTEDLLNAQTFILLREYLRDNAFLNDGVEPVEMPYPGWEACHAYLWAEHPDTLQVITNANAEEFTKAVDERTERVNQGHPENIETTLNRRGFFAAVGTVEKWRDDNTNELEARRADSEPLGEHVASVKSLNTGGGFVVDIVTLKSGQVLGIGEDNVVLYASLEDFQQSREVAGKFFAL